MCLMLPNITFHMNDMHTSQSNLLYTILTVLSTTHDMYFFPITKMNKKKKERNISVLVDPCCRDIMFLSLILSHSS